MVDSIKAGISTKLESLAITANVFFQRRKAGALPATVYNIVGATPFGASHDSGTTPFRKFRLQLDVFAVDIEGGETAMEQVESFVEEYFQAIGNWSGDLGVAGFEDVVIMFDSNNPDPVLDYDPAVEKGIQARSMDFMVSL